MRHPVPIGPSGKYLIGGRVFTHGVKILFLGDASPNSDNLTSDQVLIDGGTKGTAAAKAELLQVS